MTTTELNYYKQKFSDILADVDASTVRGELILEAFEAAITEWLEHSQAAAKSYNELLKAFRY